MVGALLVGCWLVVVDCVVVVVGCVLVYGGGCVGCVRSCVGYVVVVVVCLLGVVWLGLCCVVCWVVVCLPRVLLDRCWL